MFEFVLLRLMLVHDVDVITFVMFLVTFAFVLVPCVENGVECCTLVISSLRVPGKRVIRVILGISFVDYVVMRGCGVFPLIFGFFFGVRSIHCPESFPSVFDFQSFQFFFHCSFADC